MIYHKLVRDRIPEIIEARGGVCKTHIATEEEYWLKIKEKLHEELAEFHEAESMEELADVLEVIETIYLVKQWNKEDVEAMRRKKAEERGGFTLKIILEEA
jgi:predicted house-cleaning noncanonical NTP pyrophosphatase (MazG superfamily)